MAFLRKRLSKLLRSTEMEEDTHRDSQGERFGSIYSGCHSVLPESSNRPDTLVLQECSERSPKRLHKAASDTVSYVSKTIRSKAALFYPYPSPESDKLLYERADSAAPTTPKRHKSYANLMSSVKSRMSPRARFAEDECPSSPLTPVSVTAKPPKLDVEIPNSYLNDGSPMRSMVGITQKLAGVTLPPSSNNVRPSPVRIGDNRIPAKDTPMSTHISMVTETLNATDTLETRGEPQIEDAVKTKVSTDTIVGFSQALAQTLDDPYIDQGNSSADRIPSGISKFPAIPPATPPFSAKTFFGDDKGYTAEDESNADQSDSDGTSPVCLAPGSEQAKNTPPYLHLDTFALPLRRKSLPLSTSSERNSIQSTQSVTRHPRDFPPSDAESVRHRNKSSDQQPLPSHNEAFLYPSGSSPEPPSMGPRAAWEKRKADRHDRYLAVKLGDDTASDDESGSDLQLRRSPTRNEADTPIRKAGDNAESWKHVAGVWSSTAGKSKLDWKVGLPSSTWDRSIAVNTLIDILEMEMPNDDSPIEVANDAKSTRPLSGISLRPIGDSHTGDIAYAVEAIERKCGGELHMPEEGSVDHQLVPLGHSVENQMLPSLSRTDEMHKMPVQQMVDSALIDPEIRPEYLKMTMSPLAISSATSTVSSTPKQATFPRGNAWEVDMNISDVLPPPPLPPNPKGRLSSPFKVGEPESALVDFRGLNSLQSDTTVQSCAVTTHSVECLASPPFPDLDVRLDHAYPSSEIFDAVTARDDTKILLAEPNNIGNMSSFAPSQKCTSETSDDVNVPEAELRESIPLAVRRLMLTKMKVLNSLGTGITGNVPQEADLHSILDGGTSPDPLVEDESAGNLPPSPADSPEEAPPPECQEPNITGKCPLELVPRPFFQRSPLPEVRIQSSSAEEHNASSLESIPLSSPRPMDSPPQSISSRGSRAPGFALPCTKSPFSNRASRKAKKKAGRCDAPPCSRLGVSMSTVKRPDFVRKPEFEIKRFESPEVKLAAYAGFELDCELTHVLNQGFPASKKSDTSLRSSRSPTEKAVSFAKNVEVISYGGVPNGPSRSPSPKGPAKRMSSAETQKMVQKELEDNYTRANNRLLNKLKLEDQKASGEEDLEFLPKLDKPRWRVPSRVPA